MKSFVSRSVKALLFALPIAALAPEIAHAADWALTGDRISHDPTLIEEGGTWYEFHTGTGIQAKRSDDGGLHWYTVPQVFATPLSWWKTYVPKQGFNDVWAPDIHAYNGKVWMYYSLASFGANTSAIGLVSATSVAAGSWKDEGLVIRTKSTDNYNAIDPNLVIDADDNPWLAFGSFWSGIKLTKLDKTTMKPTGSLYGLATRAKGIEGASITYRNGYYYLFASIDKCCQGVKSTYKIVYGRSSKITGPYLDKKGVNMKSGGGTVLDAGNFYWIGPGGQDIYDGDIIARHAYDAFEGGVPKLLISDLNWDASGWPTY